jgi:hypothetical protein
VRVKLRVDTRVAIPANGSKPLTQFFPISPIPTVAKRAEPLIAMGLSNRCACPNNLSAFATSVARGADLIQPTKGWGKFIGLG